MRNHRNLNMIKIVLRFSINKILSKKFNKIKKFQKLIDSKIISKFLKKLVIRILKQMDSMVYHRKLPKLVKIL